MQDNECMAEFISTENWLWTCVCQQLCL